MEIEALDWAKGGGLIPAVVQDGGSGRVLMLGYMNAQALRTTIDTGLVTFWSRSRQTLWSKGETSGNSLKLLEVRTDCDQDALLVIAERSGPVCHEGTISCFGRDTDSTALEVLAELDDLIRRRRSEAPEDSYTSSLFRAGIHRIAQKVGEEAVEVLLSCMQDRERTIAESADLVYHLLVLLAERQASLQDVVAELTRRRKPDLSQNA